MKYLMLTLLFGLSSFALTATQASRITLESNSLSLIIKRDFERYDTYAALSLMSTVYERLEYIARRGRNKTFIDRAYLNFDHLNGIAHILRKNGYTVFVSEYTRHDENQYDTFNNLEVSWK